MITVIDIFVYNQKNSHTAIRAEHLFSCFSEEFKINYYYKEKNDALSNFTCYLKRLGKILKDRPDIAYAVDFGPGTAFLFLILKILLPSIKIGIDTGDLAYELKKIAGRSFLEQQIFRWVEWYLLKIAAIHLI